jgi:putative SOS response-associated peptidase YedK
VCGRFTLRTPADRLGELFDLDDIPALEPRYNIAPTQPVAIIRTAEMSGRRELTMARWGLVPFWAKDVQMAAKSINARSESIADKPTFREAFRRRRCLVLADGFYEWKTEGKVKIPYYIHLADGRPFAFAGLWERWKGQSPPLETCTIITTSASAIIRGLHDRMPVILPEDRRTRWLDGTLGIEGLVPYEGRDLNWEPVSPTVNNVRNDSPACLDPARDPESLF